MADAACMAALWAFGAVPCHLLMRLSDAPLRAVRGAPLNSEERRAARRARREKARAEKRAERIERCTLEEIADLNNLYKAAQQASRGVSWKASVQRYGINALRNCTRARNDILNGRDVCKGFIHFDIWERGKLRHISSVHFAERVVQKSLSQNALVPAMVPTFVAGNSANVKGRGTDYAVRRLKRQLVAHYREHGCEGYVLLVDFSDYFARIDHNHVKEIVAGALGDERVVALAHSMIDAQGEGTGLGLGSEPNQICAVAYPSAIDHYVEEMCGVEAYGRYMDDTYCIHESKEYLQIVQLLIERKCDELGIVINPRKTRIVKLTKGFTFLKKRFSYGPNGRIIMRPCRASVTRERRKLKKLAKMHAEGSITYEQVLRSYMSWRGSMKKLDAHRTVQSMDSLFAELFDSENLPRGGCH